MTGGKDLLAEVPKTKLAEAILTDYMRESLNEVALAEGFKNYELNVNHGSAIGDGFVGVLYKVTISEIDSDKTLAVVLKFPPSSKARRYDLGAMELFKREVFVYKELLPEFVKFQKDKRIEILDGFFNFPKCYFAEFDEEKDDSIIIMEDLRETGYKMWDKLVPINLEHAKLLIAALGRFHAVSFAVKAQNPKLFEKIKGMKDYLFGTMFAEDNMLKALFGFIDRASEAIDETDVERRNKVLTLKENYAQLVDPDLAEPFSVLGHGDCWSNNFMYQYKGESPQKAVLLDWQISRYCSPVLDFVHFIFACTDGDLRAKHYEEFLNIYHQSLKELLDRLGGNTESQFPFTSFLQQLKQFGRFGLLMGSMIIPMSSAKNENIPDMDKMAESMKEDPKTVEKMMKALSKGNDNVKLRLRAVILDCIHFGYL